MQKWSIIYYWLVICYITCCYSAPLCLRCLPTTPNSPRPHITSMYAENHGGCGTSRRKTFALCSRKLETVHTTPRWMLQAVREPPCTMVWPEQVEHQCQKERGDDAILDHKLLSHCGVALSVIVIHTEPGLVLGATSTACARWDRCVLPSLKNRWQLNIVRS